jgi:hypothetical protein
MTSKRKLTDFFTPNPNKPKALKDDRINTPATTSTNASESDLCSRPTGRNSTIKAKVDDDDFHLVSSKYSSHINIEAGCAMCLYV